MQIKSSHTYAAPLDAVLDMFADRDATRAKYEGMGHRDVEIVDVARTAETLTIDSLRVVDVDLPGFARRVLKPTNTMRQHDEWRSGSGGAWSGTFGVEVEGAPVELSGAMRLVPGEGTCSHEVTITMNVKVPLVGGKIADWVGKNDAKRTLEAEFAFGDTWLTEHPA